MVMRIDLYSKMHSPSVATLDFYGKRERELYPLFSFLLWFWLHLSPYWPLCCSIFNDERFLWTWVNRDLLPAGFSTICTSSYLSVPSFSMIKGSILSISTELLLAVLISLNFSIKSW